MSVNDVFVMFLSGSQYDSDNARVAWAERKKQVQIFDSFRPQRRNQSQLKDIRVFLVN